MYNATQLYCPVVITIPSSFETFFQTTLIPLVDNHPALWLLLVGFSVASFLATLVLIPWLVLRIPQDFFLGDKPEPSRWLRLHPVLRLLLHLGKNLVGLLLVAIGVLLLVLPGQGLLTIVFGLLLLDFPGRFRTQRWLIQRPSVLRSVNWLRRRYGRRPLRFESSDPF